MPRTDPYQAKIARLQKKLSRRLLNHYQSAILSLRPAISTVKFKGRLFSLDQYPAMRKQVDKVIKKLQSEIFTSVHNGIMDAWALSNAKNDAMVTKRLGGKRPSPAGRKLLYDPNMQAMEAFANRRERGLNLSERVWSALDPFKKEIEQTLGLGVSEGAPATEIAKDLQRNLVEPDRLYRRVRSESGKLVLSKAARDYHPGRGVYRSSYKNAMRVARTETNMAYRAADHERWNQLPFVTGVRVNLSAMHPYYDICDQVQGVYPKDFKFVGWHPQCLCYATSEMLSDADYDKIEDAILAGEPVDVPKSKMVGNVPSGFKDYVKKNADMLARLKNTPYWMRDNPGYL